MQKQLKQLKQLQAGSPKMFGQRPSLDKAGSRTCLKDDDPGAERRVQCVYNETLALALKNNILASWTMARGFRLGTLKVKCS